MLTRRGWIAVATAAAFLVAGRVLGTLELMVVGAVVGALVAVAVAWTALTRLQLTVDRDLHPPKVHAGSPSRVELTVENQGRRRTPVLDLRDAVSGTRGAHLLVAPLAAGDAARASYRLPTERRGILEIGPLWVDLSDPFGLTSLAVRASGVSELTVYPHIDDIVPVPQTTGNDPLAGAEHPNALGRSGEDFYALRPYVVGDDLRRVHWASTARHDELMVRQDELPWQGRATVLVDVRAATNSEASLELVISAAASIVNASARRQDLVRLITTDGADTGFAAGHAHIEGVMEHLAAVEASHDASFRRVIDRAARSSTGGALVAIVAEAGTADLDRISQLRKRFGSVTIVRFDRSAWDPSAPVPAATNDGMLVVDRRAPFRDRWNATMQRRPGRRRVDVRPPPTPAGADDDRWARHARVLP